MLMRVFEKYRLEGVEMPQTDAEWRREFLESLLLEERSAGASPSEVLKKFTPEERLKDLSPQERLKDLSPNELIRGLSPEVLEALRKNLAKVAPGQDDLTR